MCAFVSLQEISLSHYNYTGKYLCEYREDGDISFFEYKHTDEIVEYFKHALLVGSFPTYIKDGVSVMGACYTFKFYSSDVALEFYNKVITRRMKANNHL